MPVTQSPLTTGLVRENRQRLGLMQEQFSPKLGVLYQSVNRWESGHTPPLPLTLKQIKLLLRRIGDQGQDLLKGHFTE